MNNDDHNNNNNNNNNNSNNNDSDKFGIFVNSRVFEFAKKTKPWWNPKLSKMLCVSRGIGVDSADDAMEKMLCVLLGIHGNVADDGARNDLTA